MFLISSLFSLNYFQFLYGLVFALIISILFYSYPAQALDGPLSANKILILDEIIVTAPRASMPVRDIGSSASIITDKELTRFQKRTLVEALATVPGLTTIQTGGIGGQASVFIRGTNANHVKVLVDGVQVNDPSSPTGAFDFGSLTVVDISRVEVLRGSQSSLYGADSLGGVINITTKKGKGLPKAQFSLEGGSFGTFNQNASISGSDKQFDYFFSVAHLRSESVPVTPPELLPAGQKVNNNFYDNWTFSARLGIALSDNWRLSIISRYSNALLKYTTDSGWPSVPNPDRNKQEDKKFLARTESAFSLLDNRIINTFGISYSNGNRIDIKPPANFSPEMLSTYNGEKTVYDWRTNFSLFNDHKFIVGAQHEHERLSDLHFSASTNNNAVFMEWQGDIFKNLHLEANIRHDSNEDFKSYATWRFAPTFVLPGTNTRLKASIGTGFKAPTLYQRFADMRPSLNFHGNPNLDPEESTSYDIGFEQPIASKRILLGVTYFHNDIRNLINTNIDFTSYSNIGQAKTYGVEAFSEIKLTDAVNLRTDYTFTLAYDDISDQELLRRPRHQASITGNWQVTKKLGLAATLSYTGAWIDGNRDFSIKRMRTSGYGTVNLAADYQVDAQTTFFSRIDNLFDLRHENPVGFLRPGFGIYAGLRFSPS